MIIETFFWIRMDGSLVEWSVTPSIYITKTIFLKKSRLKVLQPKKEYYITVVGHYAWNKLNPHLIGRAIR